MRVIIAAGGTAGHINPAISIAQHLKRMRPETEILFVGGKGGMEEKLVPAAGFNLRTVRVHGIRRSLKPRDIWYNIISICTLPFANGEAGRILEDFKPDVCVGTGGYASYPIISRAAERGIPTAIHESNVLPGLTTRRLSKVADCVMVAFEEGAENISGAGKVIFTGNPLREGLIFKKREEAQRELGIAGDTPYVVSFWGSLGAREMNKVMADFIALEVKDKSFSHTHATGSFGWKWVPGLLEEKGVDRSAMPGFELVEYINDMPLKMAAADLVICRAGAMTLSEICAAGTPSIIVPSPNVTDNHQEKNARALEKRGAAVVLLEENLNGQTLFNEAKRLLGDRAGLKNMSRRALEMGVFDGAERICKTLICLAKGDK